MMCTIAVLLGIRVVIAAVWNPTDDEGKHNFVSSVIYVFFCLSIAYGIVRLIHWMWYQ